MRTAPVLLSALFLLPAAARTQVIYESSTGTSSIALRDAGAVGINFADGSVEVGYVRAVSTSPWRLGGAVEVASSDGFAELFEDSEYASPELSGSFFVGHVREPEGGRLLYSLLGAQLGYSHADLALAAHGDDGVLAVQDESFDAASATLVYNAFLERFLFPQETLLGVAARYGRRSNFHDLDEVEVCEAVATGSSEAGAPVTAESCETARFGDYETRSELSADLDLIWYQRWARNRIALALLARYNDPEHADELVPGVGAFFTVDGQPMRFLGGITGEYADDGWSLGLQVGFPFGAGGG